MRATLDGLKVIELGGVGPVAFAGMMLADHGAQVITLERPDVDRAVMAKDPLKRSRDIVRVDLKTDAGRSMVRTLCREADGVIEGFRPGVLERLGLSPESLLEENPRLVIGRATGWGQTGPRAQDPGHDLNFVGIAGLLHACGTIGEPTLIPLNISGLLLAFGMTAALINVARTGKGQVIDCSIVDGAALVMSTISALYSQGHWQDERGVNGVDGGAHYYGCYRTSDDKFLAVGAFEPQFYRGLLNGLGLADDPDFAQQYDKAAWPGLKARLADIFASRPRAYWLGLFGPGETCLTPVLSLNDAPKDLHNRARQTFFKLDGVQHVAPAPRFSRTPARAPTAHRTSASPEEALARMGIPRSQITALVTGGIVS